MTFQSRDDKLKDPIFPGKLKVVLFRNQSDTLHRFFRTHGSFDVKDWDRIFQHVKILPAPHSASVGLGHCLNRIYGFETSKLVPFDSSSELAPIQILKLPGSTTNFICSS